MGAVELCNYHKSARNNFQAALDWSRIALFIVQRDKKIPLRLLLLLADDKNENLGVNQIELWLDHYLRSTSHYPVKADEHDKERRSSR